jgi:hypothetical protein
MEGIQNFHLLFTLIVVTIYEYEFWCEGRLYTCLKIMYEIVFVSNNYKENKITYYVHGIGAKLWDCITQNLYLSTACLSIPRDHILEKL